MCDRNDQGQVIDPIFGELIPDEYVVTFEQNGVEFCLDLRVLAEDSYRSGKYLNPLNRQELPVDLRGRIDTYIQQQQVQVQLDLPFASMSSITVSKFDSIAKMLIDVYTSNNARERIGYDKLFLIINGVQSEIPSTNMVIADLPGMSTASRMTLLLDRTYLGFNHEDRGRFLAYARQNNIEWLEDLMNAILEYEFDYTTPNIPQLDRLRNNEDVLAYINAGYIVNVHIVEYLQARIPGLNLPALYRAAIDPYNYNAGFLHYTSIYNINEDQDSAMEEDEWEISDEEFDLQEVERTPGPPAISRVQRTVTIIDRSFDDDIDADMIIEEDSDFEFDV